MALCFAGTFAFATLIDLGAAVLGSLREPGDSAAALMRSIVQGNAFGEVAGSVAIRGALEARFPLGSDAAALLSFLAAVGPGHHARCRQDRWAEEAHHHCQIVVGSWSATVLGLRQWQRSVWRIGVVQDGRAGVIRDISVAPLSVLGQLSVCWDHLGLRLPDRLRLDCGDGSGSFSSAQAAALR